MLHLPLNPNKCKLPQSMHDKFKWDHFKSAWNFNDENTLPLTEHDTSKGSKDVFRNRPSVDKPVFDNKPTCLFPSKMLLFPSGILWGIEILCIEKMLSTLSSSLLSNRSDIWNHEIVMQTIYMLPSLLGLLFQIEKKYGKTEHESISIKQLKKWKLAFDL